jgi:hypothetical protein
VDGLETPTKVTLDNPQQIVWQKPTTDAQWAEDVKAEHLDIKSTDILQEMLSSHLERLQQLQIGYNVYIDCPTCVQYNIHTSNPDWSNQDIANAYQNEYSAQTWSVEKLKQSIERIQHELDLRARGVVVADKLDKKGTKARRSDLEKVQPEYVRIIND